MNYEPQQFDGKLPPKFYNDVQDDLTHTSARILEINVFEEE